MRKAKIVALVLALLMVVTAFAACGKFEKPGQVFDTTDKSPTYTTVTQVSVTGIIEEAEGWLAVMCDETADGKTVSKLVNLAENKALLELTDTDTLSYELEICEVGKSVVALVTTVDTSDSTKEKVTVTLYDKNGTKVVESDKLTEEDVDIFADLFVFGESVYRVAENGAVTLAFEHKKYEGALPEINCYTDEYYLYVSSYAVVAYDKNLDLLSFYVPPSYAQNVMAFALNNGNIFVQYRVALPDDAKDYDLYAQGTKYDLVTVIVDPDDADADEINFEYLLSLGRSRAGDLGYFKMHGYADSIENIAICYPIVDHRIDQSELTVKYLVISNNGQVKADLLEMIPNQIRYNEVPALSYGEDLFLAINAGGERVLIDASNKVVANLGSNRISNANELYVVVNGVIYDHDMKKLLDLEEKEMTIERMFDRAIILEDEDGKLYLFNGGAEPALIDGDDTTEIVYIASNIFAVKKTASDGKVTYTYYNDTGAVVLADSEIALSYYEGIDDGAATILSGTNSESKTVYYIFK